MMNLQTKQKRNEYVDITDDLTSNISLFIIMFQRQMFKLLICILNDELTAL